MLRIAIAGGTGMIGTALIGAWRTAGHTAVPISRQNLPDAIHWDPAAGQLDGGQLEGFDVIVNLAGESLAARRWTQSEKHRIESSRLAATNLLVHRLLERREPPRVVISASAVGYYGDRGNDILDDSQPSGDDFLAGVCRQWEAACHPLRARGIRVVHPRFGMVLSSTGGALLRMLPIFRLGLGGRFGRGTQWMSWIAIDDVVAAIDHLIADSTIVGPCNVVSPQPVRNAEFAATLGRVLHRPAALPVPAPLLRLGLGEMADAALLASQRAVPERLLKSGFAVALGDLREALHQYC